jgi:glycosyltransferase involved in cell wall biosynthesis
VDDIAHAVDRLLSDSELRGRMAAAARQRAHAEFSKPRLVADMERIYEDAYMTARRSRRAARVTP